MHTVAILTTPGAAAAGIGPGDWPSIASAFVAVCAVAIAVWQTVVARKAAQTATNAVTAASEQAAAAERSAEVAERQFRSAQALADAERFGHAALIIVELTENKDKVCIRNDAPVPMLQVIVTQITGPEFAPLKLSGRGSEENPIEVLHPSEKIFVTASLQPSPGTRTIYPDVSVLMYAPTIEFTDLYRTRWSRTGNKTPEPQELIK